MITVDFEDNRYPKKLKNIPKVPKRLYVDGNIENLNCNFAIAVVGSRDNSEYGEKWCKYFVKKLIEYNITIVSGMAVGIDTIAHETALKYGGKTIAVLPCGLNNIFPPENIGLYKRILKYGGTIISEYTPSIKATSSRFLERNRIVSGISNCLLVVEAEYRSGTSVTAKLAFSQNREVFCIPGSLDNTKSIGTNRLIKDFAKIATTPYDILQQYGFVEIDKKSKIIDIISQDALDDIDEEYKKIYKVIKNEPIDVNEIAKLSHESLKDTMSKLTMMELSGKIKKISGNRYIRD